MLDAACDIERLTERVRPFIETAGSDQHFGARFQRRGLFFRVPYLPRRFERLRGCFKD